MREPNPKIWNPRAKPHNGSCITFHVDAAGHECVECGKRYPQDDIDRRILEGMRQQRESVHG